MPVSETTSLIGSSPPFVELLEEVSRVAPLDRPVLVVGERGTGKELVAARVHYLSRRWDQPLVTMNCATLPETLLETELFGHEAGAFTGAVRRRAGRFELADGGTLFLDELATASLRTQEQILRVIEYGRFERVGASGSTQVDVRIVGATNVDLPAAARAGRFRHDLLDRLAFDVLTLPPLRARGDDILALAEHFARAMASELGHESFAGFSPDALETLHGYAWPGNVRELKNAVERAVYRGGDGGMPVGYLALDPFDSPYRPQGSTAAGAPSTKTPLPPAPAVPDGRRPVDFRAEVGAMEKCLLTVALEANRHNQRATARHLNLSYHQLRNLLRKHGLAPSASPPATRASSDGDAP